MCCRNVLDTFGLWCAVRGALVLVVRIEKMKMREKYERHYLILGLIYSELLKVHKICEEGFDSVVELTEKDKMVKYSSPKMGRLMEVLRQYKPDHVNRSQWVTFEFGGLLYFLVCRCLVDAPCQ